MGLFRLLTLKEDILRNRRTTEVTEAGSLLAEGLFQRSLVLNTAVVLCVGGQETATCRGQTYISTDHQSVLALAFTNQPTKVSSWLQRSNIEDDKNKVLTVNLARLIH